MHYDCINGSHGLPHDPFKAIVAPRPIGWIGSKGKSGIKNLAPYSYFNAVADKQLKWLLTIDDVLAYYESTGDVLVTHNRAFAVHVKSYNL